MVISRRSGLWLSASPLSRLQCIVIEMQRRKHTSAGESGNSALGESSSNSTPESGSFDPSIWKTIDSRTVGIKRSSISRAAWTVLKNLQGKGFEAYLVGGCVRDLLLKRIPKDFDVITTASLGQIKKHFHRCRLIRCRFPICHVHVLGSIIEVSSFSTSHKNARERKGVVLSETPGNYNEKDIRRWKNCMKRDFTINGLFFDPVDCTIYDYVNGLRDIQTAKVSTVIPAHLSFKEDCARILRGLRIVARLGLRFSKETARAIRELSFSIKTLDRQRLFMELDFMLAYGGAESSIWLLQKYRLLTILLPFHGAYLADLTKEKSNGRHNLLTKLFSSADKLLAADRPCHCTSWLGLLAFHLAVVHYPQDARVVWAFSSVLYYGTWSKAVESLRQCPNVPVLLVPEILSPTGTKSDELLAEETSRLASLLTSSVNVLTSSDALQHSLARFPEASRSLGQVLVSAKMGRNVSKLFSDLDGDIASYSKGRETYSINYELLRKGDPDETRFLIGKIIMDTINDRAHVLTPDAADRSDVPDKITDQTCVPTPDAADRNDVPDKITDQTCVPTPDVADRSNPCLSALFR